MHYYSHHIGDLIRDTANLNDHQLATYMRMIWEYYSAEKPITGDMEDVAFAMRSDEKTIRLLLRHYFVECDDGWRHARCDREIALFHEKAEKASQSAKARWSNKQPQKMQEECDGNANASASDASARVLDANQEPRTKNQEPIKPKERKPNVASTTIDPIKTDPPFAVGSVGPEKPDPRPPDRPQQPLADLQMPRPVGAFANATEAVKICVLFRDVAKEKGIQWRGNAMNPRVGELAAMNVDPIVLRSIAKQCCDQGKNFDYAIATAIGQAQDVAKRLSDPPKPKADWNTQSGLMAIAAELGTEAFRGEDTYTFKARLSELQRVKQIARDQSFAKQTVQHG